VTARSGIEARTLFPGSARGCVLRLDEPLSLWGGMDPGTGRVIDRRHPQAGENIAGKVLMMPSGRGSSSSSSILAEALRAGTAPVAVILGEPDPILVVGAAVSSELYGRAIPIVVLESPNYDAIGTGDEVEIEATAEDAIVRPA
jgi:predicted aconitase with swiveling domain